MAACLFASFDPRSSLVLWFRFSVPVFHITKIRRKSTSSSMSFARPRALGSVQDTLSRLRLSVFVGLVVRPHVCYCLQQQTTRFTHLTRSQRQTLLWSRLARSCASPLFSCPHGGPMTVPGPSPLCFWGVEREKAEAGGRPQRRRAGDKWGSRFGGYVCLLMRPSAPSPLAPSRPKIGKNMVWYCYKCSVVWAAVRPAPLLRGCLRSARAAPAPFLSLSRSLSARSLELLAIFSLRIVN